MPAISKNKAVAVRRSTTNSLDKSLSKTFKTINYPAKEVHEPDKPFKSVFRRTLKDIKKTNVGNDDPQQEAKMLLEALRSMVINLIPIMEENLTKYKNERAAYGLNVLINNVREITNDIQAHEDFQSRSDKIVDMIHSHYITIIQNLLDEAMKCKSNLISSLFLESDNIKQQVVTDVMKQFLREHGTFVKSAEVDITTQVDSFLVRPKTVNKGRGVSTR